MSYTVIIADDESLARDIVRDYLKAYPEFKIIGECDNGLDAVDKINALKPDVVFLDIQMPELTGIEVVERLERVPHIIFSTAYDAYAIKAFEMNAVDYLLKPYDANRFETSMVRLLKNLENHQVDANQITKFLDSFRKPNSFPERLLVPDGDGMVFIHVQDIVYAEAMENYTQIVTEKTSYLVLQSISEIEAKLDPEHFFRVHRSFIVRLDDIQNIQPWSKGSFRVLLKNGNALPLSRRRVKDLKERFGI